MMHTTTRALFIAVLLLSACEDKNSRTLDKMAEENPSEVLADLSMTSDVIVEGQILRIFLKYTNEVGAIECTYQLLVKDIVKGSIEYYMQENLDCHGFENVQDSVILFGHTHYEFQAYRSVSTPDFYIEAEHQRCDRVLLFLRSPVDSATQIHLLADRWVGALKSTHYLTEYVKWIVKKEG